MKVILLGELRGKGGEGDVVEVAQGFAENYLFPNGIAQPATPGNMKQLEERRHNIAKREEKRVADAEALKAQIDGKVVVVDAKIGEEGQLFGSVTTTMIADAIEQQLGVEVDRKRVGKGQTIKTAGLHKVDINIYREIGATVTVQVGKNVETEDEAVAEPEAEVVEEAVEAEAAAEVEE
ncbi:MAG: 50S ribosomal protein L9 [Atopobiaceae bacterium]|jgi:large subunit ribosomal protein L9|nr:50S ribosomal protein L9 [Atopobiaceae bacterium]